MSDKARAHLKKIIDLLESNVWLELDEASSLGSLLVATACRGSWGSRGLCHCV